MCTGSYFVVFFWGGEVFMMGLMGLMGLMLALVVFLLWRVDRNRGITFGEGISLYNELSR